MDPGALNSLQHSATTWSGCAPPYLLLVFHFEFSEHFWPIMLACGSFLLSGALIVLMVTRWGQARLLSKCAALSLLAHLLIIGYAQIIPIAVHAVGAGEGEGVPVNFDEGVASTTNSKSESVEAKPWDIPPPGVAEAPAPTTPSLERPRVEGADVERPLAASDPTMERALPTELPEQTPLATPPLTQPITRAPDLKPNASVTADAPAAQRQNDTPEIPVGPVPARQTKPDIDTLGQRRFATSDNPSDVTEPGSRIQSIDGLPAIGDSLDALLGPDNPQAALNKGPGARERNDPRSPPEQRVAGGSPAVAMAIPKRAGDGAAVPNTYRLREHGARERVIGRLGGSKETEAAVALSLGWLARTQSADGRWNAAAHGAGRGLPVDGQDRKGAGADADTAITALAVLTFLADGQSHLEGEQRQHVQKGLEFLIGSQAADGNLSGGASTFSMMYCHGMASLAVSEAYALTGDKRLKPYVERAIKYTVNAQNTSTGGWRYQPGDEGDMSQFGWQVMSLRSADLAGITVPPGTKLGMQRFLRSCTSGTSNGLASYRPRERATRSMTAEALACRFFLDFDRGEKVMDEATRFVLQETPTAPGKPNLYYWYYATLAMHQIQDSRWDAWNSALQKRLLELQIKEGDLAGSYPTDDVWGGYGGSVFTTSLATLCLEVYYRYLPVYAPKK